MCISVYMCADGTAPNLRLPLVGVEVRLWSKVDKHYISHMASSKNPKRPFEEDSSDDERTPSEHFGHIKG